ncbi:MAG: GNAT family N-acetyltransferase [Candidatus Micrarchaeaceae archaeon]
MANMIKKATVSKFSIMPACPNDVKDIVKLINAEHDSTNSVLKVKDKEVEAWIEKGLSYVAKDENGKIIGHQAVHIWHIQPGCDWAEFRSSVVTSDYRGKGISKQLKQHLIDLLSQSGINTFVLVKNDQSKGHHTLNDMGFEKIENSQVPPELFSVGEGADLNPDTWTVYIKQVNILKAQIRN